ncbi:MAG TPA: MFS transporter [Aggregatilineales bacterium]|nr:MFS transporter [Aggregatilineales bacterium]
MLRSLKHRPFALLWSGQTVSRLGDSLYRIALAWWVVQKTGSPAVMGAILIFSFTPMLIFVLIGGLAADRLPRIRLMLASDVLRGALVIVVALLAALNVLEVWHLFAASFVFGFVDAFFQPAYAAIIPELTPKDLLTSANSLTSVSGQVANIAGPGLGAAIVALGGTPLAFGLDALTFFIAAACVVPILGLSYSQARQNDPAKPRASLWHDLREGLQTVFGSAWLWITILLAALINITISGPMSVALPFLVKTDLQMDVSVYGLVASVQAIGLVVGTILVGRQKRIHHRGWYGYSALMISGLMVAMMGMRLGIWAVIPAIFVFGIAIAAFNLIWTNAEQELVPMDKLGRVFSIDQLGSFVLLPIGYGVAGWLTDRLSASTVFLLGGIITMILIGIGLAQPDIRHLD